MKDSIVRFSGLLLMILLSLPGCRKDPEPVLKPQGIIIGDYEGMIVDSTVTTIDAPYNGYEHILIDLDQDSTADLRLLVAMPGSPGMGIRDVSELQPLHQGTALFGTFTLDSTFLREEHFIFSDDYNHYHNSISHYSCRRKSPFDRITETDLRFHLVELKKGEVLDPASVFSVDTVSFIYNWYFHGIQTFENDTVYLRSSDYEFDCQKLPYNKAIYLGVKMLDSPARLGWIQLVLESESQIRLKEVAFQKK